MKFQTYLYLIFLFLNFAVSSAQIKIGEIAPSITISDYVLNYTGNQDVKNKYIVLEFWATWCKPCLEQVPHINDLQEKFEKNKQLQFISITNEKPEKIARTLNRVPFKTMVVCDQSGNTFANFISDKDGNYSIPKTILIDNKGIIKWIGLPNDLSEDIINNFIADENLNEVQIKGSVVASPEILAPVQERLIDVAYKLTYNDENKYSFIFLNGNANEFKMEENTLETHGVYFTLNTNLTALMAKLSNTFESRISISKELKSRNFSLFYKNSLFLNTDSKIKDLKSNLLKTLNLIENVSVKKADVYTFMVVDRIKLENAINSPERLNSDSNANFILLDCKIDQLIDKLSFYLGTSISSSTSKNNFVNKEQLYDFVLRKSSLDVLIEDLNYYGIAIIKSQKNQTFFDYSNE